MEVCRNVTLVQAHNIKQPSISHLMTCQASQNISELALEIVNHDAVITHPVDLPFLRAGQLGWESLKFPLTFRRRRWQSGLLNDAVEIFVQPVEQEAQKLLRVMLVRAAELRCIGTDLFLMDSA